MVAWGGGLGVWIMVEIENVGGGGVELDGAWSYRYILESKPGE